ncbi:MAG TPA: methyltransferase domain-containing protein [Gaiellaceae bacterium]|nr:methyltransferase domain-containing protein [Gaiellaceae bacterium]
MSLWELGAPYERYVGRWSRLVARELVDWLAVAAGATWLDVGSGTGALAGTVLEVASPGSVTAVDSSEGFVDHARSAVPGATFVVGDAQALPFADDSFDVVVSGLVLNFVPDQPRAVAEMTRVARPGGTVAAYVWDYAGRMELMRHFWDAAGELDPAARALDEGQRFRAFERPEGLERLFAGAGQADVESRAIDIPTVFGDFDDYWEPFLGGQGPAPSYVSGLGEAERSRLRELLRRRLPSAADGSISLVARAWAACGRKP